MTQNETRSASVENFYDRRQKRLLVAAWAATLLPLLAFFYLTWQSVELKRQNQRMADQVADKQAELSRLDAQVRDLEKRKAQVESDLAAQRKSTKHYRDVAGIRIQFYRESDRAVVEKALVNLGFRLDTNLGRSALIGREPNTIAYGNRVSEQDLRDIAVALVQAGFPLKRITPAVIQPDPKLVQIYASAESDRNCGLLDEEEIRGGRTCGRK